MNRQLLINLTTATASLAAGLVLNALITGKYIFLVGIGAGAIPATITTIALTRGKTDESAKDMKLKRRKADIAKLKTELQTKHATIENLQAEINKLTLKTKESDIERKYLTTDSARLNELVEEVTELRNQVRELEATKVQYEQDWQEMQVNWDKSIGSEVQTRLKDIQLGEIQRIWKQTDDYRGRCRDACDEATKLLLEFKQRADNSKEVALSIGKSAHDALSKKAKELETLQEQLQIKETRISLLNQERQGELTEPKYGNFSLELDSRVADNVARELWNQKRTPLSVEGYKSNPDGTAEAAYTSGRSINLETVATVINGDKEGFAKALGVWSVLEASKHELCDVLLVSWQRDRPQPADDDEIYRILEQANESVKLLKDSLNPEKGGFPTLRIMGATGQGKAIITKRLIEHWVATETGEVWFSDPMDGSSQDRWEIPKAAKSSVDAHKLLGKFVTEYHNRKDKKSAQANVQVLGVFDEFDKEHPDDDKETVKSIWTGVRHQKMQLILIGQVGGVGSNGWVWDDMRNCACLFVGTSIATGLKNHKHLGISRAEAGKLERQYDRIKLWLDAKNEGLEGGGLHRVALLVTSNKTRFLELPLPLKGGIETGKASIVLNPWESIVTDSNVEKQKISVTKMCPGCGGKLEKSEGKLRCKNTDHTKAMGRKTFSLNE